MPEIMISGIANPVTPLTMPAKAVTATAAATKTGSIPNMPSFPLVQNAYSLPPGTLHCKNKAVIILQKAMLN
ncbi:hypothetical protein [Rhodovulum sp. P5]|uniref:hypothetical protein n=1 Tax=Rhodovulum sp. P5 TaxID=1564506 RepID=UPI0020A4057A|nr:hypothetical protein [Rhodovulum sp. P5]